MQTTCLINKAKKILCAGALAGVLFMGAGSAAEATKFTFVECENKGEPLKITTPQKEAARQALPTGVRGSFENKFVDNLGLAAACAGAMEAYLHLDNLPNLHAITPESKNKLQEYIAKLGHDGLEARAQKRVSRHITAPQPFGDSKIFYLICKGEPVYTTDKDGKITGVDAEKTQFVGRFVDHAIIAYALDLHRNINGGSVGKALVGTTSLAQGYMLYKVIDRKLDIYNKNPQGQVDFTNKASDIISKYWMLRLGNDKSPKEIEKELIESKAWHGYGEEEGEIVYFYNERVDSVLASPQSRIRRNNGKLAAALHKSRAKDHRKV